MARSVRKSNHPVYQGRRTPPVSERGGYVTLCWCLAPEHAVGTVGTSLHLRSPVPREGTAKGCRHGVEQFRQALRCAQTGRCQSRVALRATSRLTVDGSRLRKLAIDANLAFGSST